MSVAQVLTSHASLSAPGTLKLEPSRHTVRLSHLPWHHAANGGPSTLAHQETHSGVCNSIPGPAHKQDDRCVEGVQLR